MNQSKPATNLPVCVCLCVLVGLIGCTMRADTVSIEGFDENDTVPKKHRALLHFLRSFVLRRRRKQEEIAYMFHWGMHWLSNAQYLFSQK